MANNNSKLRIKISFGINAHKQKMEDMYGEKVRSKSYKNKRLLVSLF